MINLHEMSPNPGSRKRRKRVGRGDSSGMGKTCCRGEKGQKARTGAKIRPFFEGGQIPLFRRLPKRGFNHPQHMEYALVNLSLIEENFNAGETVEEATLREKNLLAKTLLPIKVLANGEITKAVTVRAAKFSAAAIAKIEAAGGKAEVVE